MTTTLLGREPSRSYSSVKDFHAGHPCSSIVLEYTQLQMSDVLIWRAGRRQGEGTGHGPRWSLGMFQLCLVIRSRCNESLMCHFGGRGQAKLPQKNAIRANLPQHQGQATSAPPDSALTPRGKMVRFDASGTAHPTTLPMLMFG